MDKNLLVSVVVVAYNAENTILETLESVKLQSYVNIELIVSDDCSKDKTVMICKEWIVNNKERFNSVCLLTAEHNQGVCRNFNKAISRVNGEWIKIIAADDLLLPDCVTDFVDYASRNSEADFITSVQKVYRNSFEEENCINPNCIEKSHVFDKDSSAQLKTMAYHNFVSAPTIFFRKELFEEVGGFDVRYPYEDHPFYISILEAGHKIYLLNKPTVCYRLHESFSNSKAKIFNYNFLLDSKKFLKERCFKYYKFNQRYAVNAYYLLLYLFEKYGLNRQKRFNILLFKILRHAIYLIGKF